MICFNVVQDRWVAEVSTRDSYAQLTTLKGARWRFQMSLLRPVRHPCTLLRGGTSKVLIKEQLQLLFKTFTLNSIWTYQTSSLFSNTCMK